MKIIISVPIRNPEGWAEVEAELLFDLAPHLADVATFAVHKEPHEPNKRAFYWNVSNLETGCWIGQHWNKSEAIRQAFEKLKDKTPESFEFAYRRTMQMHPRLES